MSFSQHEYVLKKTILLLPTCREWQLTSNCLSHFYFFIQPKSVSAKLYISILSVLCGEWQTLTRLPLTNFYNTSVHRLHWNNVFKKAFFLYFSTAIAGKILVTAKCSITRNAAPPPGTETPVKGTVTMFQLVRCYRHLLAFSSSVSDQSYIFEKLSVVGAGKLSYHGRIGNTGRPTC